MKNLILASLIALSSVAAFAAETLILERQIPAVGLYMTNASARFQVDQNTSEGFVDVVVTDHRPANYPFPGPGYCDHFGRCYPHRDPMPMPITIFSERVKVEGLMLMGETVMYHGAEGNVDCGRLGVSRIFRKPTIYLNGNCKLTAQITGNYRDQRVIVKLITK